MKLLRFGDPGRERPGLLDAEDRVRDVSSIVGDINGRALSDEALHSLREIAIDTLPLAPDGVRLGPCVANGGKLVCIGLNYRDHARETGATAPTEPIVFMKATSAIQGPNDAVVLPRGAVKTDWEVELGVVIGRHAKDVEADEALSYVAGYCVINDLSERAFQLERGGTWDKGCDTFGPLGPYLVTRDEVPDPQHLRLWLEVDGHRYQDGTTSDMIFGVAELVSDVSRFMSRHPGDVISTGTPDGVGMGQRPAPIYLRPGQRMRLGIEGLGEQIQSVMAERDA